MGTSINTLTLERCTQVIEKIILPDLRTDYAIHQATALVTILRILSANMEEKVQSLREENRKMKEVLGLALDVFGSEKALSRNLVAGDLTAKLAADLKDIEAGSPGDGEENEILKGTMVETIRGLDALIDYIPAETISSLRGQIRSAIRQQLEHGIARIAGRGFSAIDYWLKEKDTDEK